MDRTSAAISRSHSAAAAVPSMMRAVPRLSGSSRRKLEAVGVVIGGEIAVDGVEEEERHRIDAEDGCCSLSSLLRGGARAARAARPRPPRRSSTSGSSNIVARGIPAARLKREREWEKPKKNAWARVFFYFDLPSKSFCSNLLLGLSHATAAALQFTSRDSSQQYRQRSPLVQSKAHVKTEKNALD